MFSAIQMGQLDLNALSGYLAGAFATGNSTALRPYQTGIFINTAYFSDSQNGLTNYLFLTSGSIVNTGQALLSGINSSGQSAASNLSQTGQTLWNRDNTLSGILSGSGRFLSDQLSGLSGSLNATGQYILGILTGQSGAIQSTGAYLLSLLSGLSGQFNQTGYNLYRLITGLSGVFNTTGAAINNFISPLSGSLIQSGALIERSGQLLSGALNQSGAILRNDIDVILSNLTRVNGLSGAMFVTGTGAVSVIQIGNTLTIQRPQADYGPGRLIDINGITGTPIITGTGNITAYTIGSGIYLSGISGVDRSVSSLFATPSLLSQTGQILLSNDLLWSGAILNQNSLVHSGLTFLNYQTGALSLSGSSSVSVVTGSGQVSLLFNGLSGIPTWATSSPDTFVSGKFDDDFTGIYLDNKWTGINSNAWELSGISNSHFFARSAASGLTSLLVMGVQTGIDFEFSMKFNELQTSDTFINMGLIWRNATSQAGETFQFDLGITSGPQFLFYTMNGVAYGSNYKSTTGYNAGFSDAYFRMQCRNKVINLDYSNNNIVWRNLVSNYTTSININQVGFLIGSRSFNNKGAGSIDWFRTTGLT